VLTENIQRCNALPEQQAVALVDGVLLLPTGAMCEALEVQYLPMKRRTIEGFEHFLSIEDKHLSDTIAFLGKDYQLILDLDTLYFSCLKVALPADDTLVMPAFLYLISHQEFYYGMAAFLRRHKAQSFRCLRAALDSTFTAYYLLKNPDETEKFLNKNVYYPMGENPFRNLKATIKNNQKMFPLAGGLMKVHDLCSKFSHADPESIFHKYFMDREDMVLHVKYFDYEKKPRDYKKWYAYLLFHFFRVFLIYWNEMLRKDAGSMKKEIAQLVADYTVRINAYRKKYPVSSF